MAKPFSNRLSSISCHYTCMQCTFPLDFAIAFFEILRCRNFLTVGFGREFIRHKLFLPVLHIAFPSSSLPLFSLLSSDSSPQPSCPYFPLSRLLFLTLLGRVFVLLSRLLPAGPHNCILSLLWLFFTSVKITIFLFLWKSQLPHLLTGPNLLFLLLRFSFPVSSPQHHNLVTLFFPFFPTSSSLSGLIIFRFLYVFLKNLFFLLPWGTAESTDK